MSVMNSKILVILITAVVLISAIGIIVASDATNSSEGAISITDDRGTTCNFTAAVTSNIASFAKPVTQILCELGAIDYIVIADSYSSDYESTYAGLSNLTSNLTLWSDGTTLVETMVANDVDVFITYYYESKEDKYAALESMGITVLAFSPGSYDEVMTLVEKLGLLTGKDDEAADLAQEMQDVLDEVTSTLEAADLSYSEQTKIYFELQNGKTVNYGSVTNSLIQLAGGINVALDVTLGSSYTASIETVIAWDPDVIVLEDHDPLTSEDALDQYGDANRTDQVVYRFTYGYNSYDSNLMYGLMEMAEYLYPDLFDY